jgi:hypothetical protein
MNILGNKIKNHDMVSASPEVREAVRPGMLNRIEVVTAALLDAQQAGASQKKANMARLYGSVAAAPAGVYQVANTVVPPKVDLSPQSSPDESETFFDDADGAKLAHTAFDRNGYIIHEDMRRELDQAAEVARANPQAFQTPDQRPAAYGDFVEVGPYTQPMDPTEAYAQNLQADLRSDQSEGEAALNIDAIRKAVDEA